MNSTPIPSHRPAKRECPRERARFARYGKNALKRNQQPGSAEQEPVYESGSPNAAPLIQHPGKAMTQSYANTFRKDQQPRVLGTSAADSFNPGM